MMSIRGVWRSRHLATEPKLNVGEGVKEAQVPKGALPPSQAMLGAETRIPLAFVAVTTPLAYLYLIGEGNRQRRGQAVRASPLCGREESPW